MNAFNPLEWPICGRGTVEVIATGRLNVRETVPSGRILGQLLTGEKATVWATGKDGWLLVQNEAGLTGWVSPAYVRESETG